MDTKLAKQRVALALDTMAMRGRFSVRDVAEAAYQDGMRYEKLSVADQRDVMIDFLTREAKTQMKAPLRQDLKEGQIKRLPSKYWPVLESLTKTICVSSGGGAQHVYTMLATSDDWECYLQMVDVMQDRVKTARNTGREIRNLLRDEHVTTLQELLTGERPRMLAVRK